MVGPRHGVGKVAGRKTSCRWSGESSSHCPRVWPAAAGSGAVGGPGVGAGFRKRCPHAMANTALRVCCGGAYGSLRLG